MLSATAQAHKTNESQSGLRPVCESAMFDTECEDFSNEPVDLRKSTTEADGMLFNWFLTSQPQRILEIARLENLPSDEVQKEALTIGEEMRQAAIHYVSGGSAEATWSPDVAALIKRLKTVTFRIPKAGFTCTAATSPGVPNANYDRDTHTITICPGLLRAPSIEIAHVLGHELGHSVSPKQMKSPLLQHQPRTKEMIACLVAKMPAPQEGTIHPYPSLKDPRSGTFFVSDNDDDLACKESVVVTPPLKDPPFYRAITKCLEALYPKPSTSSKAKPKKKSNLPTTRERNERQQEEHFADTFGSFAFAQQRTAVGASKFKNSIHMLRNLRCMQIKTNSESSWNYPTDEMRLDLSLRPKEVANILGCTPSTKPICALNENSFAPVTTQGLPDNSQSGRIRK